MKGRASLPGADELFRVTSIEKGRGRGAKQPAEEARRDDRRVVTVDGRMVENLHVDGARRVLATAEAVAALG